MARFGAADEIALLDGLAGLEEVSLGDTPKNGRRRRSLDASFRASLSGLGDSIDDACTRFGLSNSATVATAGLGECGIMRILIVDILKTTPAALEAKLRGPDGVGRVCREVIEALSLVDSDLDAVTTGVIRNLCPTLLTKALNKILPPATPPKTRDFFGRKVALPPPPTGGGGASGSAKKLSTGVKVAIGVGAAGAALLVLPRLLGR